MKKYQLALALALALPLPALGGAANLSFDPSVIQVVNVSLKAPQDIGGMTGAIDNILGTITGIGFASFNGVRGDFSLATVEFQGVGPGTSQLNVTDAKDLPSLG